MSLPSVKRVKPVERAKCIDLVRNCLCGPSANHVKRVKRARNRGSEGVWQCWQAGGGYWQSFGRAIRLPGAFRQAIVMLHLFPSAVFGTLWQEGVRHD